MSNKNSEMMIDMVASQEPIKERVENHETRKALNKAGVSSFKAAEGEIIEVQNYYGDEQLVGRNYHDLNKFLETLPDFDSNESSITESTKNLAKKAIDNNLN